MALEKIEGVTAAYVDKDISLHYSAKGSVDKEAIAKVLKPLKMEIKEAKKLEKLPF